MRFQAYAPDGLEEKLQIISWKDANNTFTKG